MKKINVARLNWSLAIFLLLAIGVVANAQKLPNVQQVSLRLPDNFKIDGKTPEWNNQFRAYNKSTDIFYTIANNNDNLYLAVQATDPDIIRKIVIGGITLTINKSGNRKDKDHQAVTFPSYDKKNQPLYLVLNQRPGQNKDTVKARIQADSLMHAYNDQISKKLIMIGIVGFKNTTDDELSIYNELGIKAASQFNNKINYTCEIAIPLKLIGFSAGTSLKFSYNIKLNGLAANGSSVQTISSARGDMLSYTGADGTNYLIGVATPQNMIQAYPTDFWGEYVLAPR